MLVWGSNSYTIQEIIIICFAIITRRRTPCLKKYPLIAKLLNALLAMTTFSFYILSPDLFHAIIKTRFIKSPISKM